MKKVIFLLSALIATLNVSAYRYQLDSMVITGHNESHPNDYTYSGVITMDYSEWNNNADGTHKMTYYLHYPNNSNELYYTMVFDSAMRLITTYDKMYSGSAPYETNYTYNEDGVNTDWIFWRSGIWWTKTETDSTKSWYYENASSIDGKALTGNRYDYKFDAKGNLLDHTNYYVNLDNDWDSVWSYDRFEYDTTVSVTKVLGGYTLIYPRNYTDPDYTQVSMMTLWREQNGYTFEGGRKVAVEDIYTPYYSPIMHVITYLDKDSNVILNDTVQEEDPAIAPEAPQVNGFRFVGWDKEIDMVMHDDTIRALYEAYEAPESLVCDFSTIAGKNSTYTNVWTYDTIWSVAGGANNAGKWDYIRVGGKNSNLDILNPCYVATATAVKMPIGSIDVTTIAGSLDKSGMSVNSWGVTVYRDAAMSQLVDSVNGSSISNAAATYTLTPSTGEYWHAGMYYKVFFDLANTSTTNGIIYLQKIEFFAPYEPITVDSLFFEFDAPCAGCEPTEMRLRSVPAEALAIETIEPYWVETTDLTAGNFLPMMTTEFESGKYYGNDLETLLEYESLFYTGYLAPAQNIIVNGTYIPSWSDSTYMEATLFYLPNMYTVTIETNMAGAGSTEGEGEYEEGSQVTVSATANDGYEFVNWTVESGTVSSDAEYTFTITGDITLTANFRATQPTEVDELQGQDAAQKVMRNGVLYIQRGGHLYTAQGQIVK